MSVRTLADLPLVFLISLFACAVRAVPISAGSQTNSSFSALVVFGDSISDNGSGVYVLSNGTWPPSQYGYDRGRFSNGKVWPDYLAENLSVPLHDYAVGGATTSNIITQGYAGNGSTIPVPSVDEQVTKFLANIPADLEVSSTLFAVTGGVNDHFFNVNASALTSASIISQQVAKLQKVGAQHFLFFNYYDISLVPAIANIQPADKIKGHLFSVGLQSALTNLHKTTPGSYFFSMASDLLPRLSFYGEPLAYGFDQYGAYGSCTTGINSGTSQISVCSDADKKVFWDEYHPSSHTHSLIARGIVEKINGQQTLE